MTGGAFVPTLALPTATSIWRRRPPGRLTLPSIKVANQYHFSLPLDCPCSPLSPIEPGPTVPTAVTLMVAGAASKHIDTLETFASAGFDAIESKESLDPTFWDTHDTNEARQTLCDVFFFVILDPISASAPAPTYFTPQPHLPLHLGQSGGVDRARDLLPDRPLCRQPLVLVYLSDPRTPGIERPVARVSRLQPAAWPGHGRLQRCGRPVSPRGRPLPRCLLQRRRWLSNLLEGCHGGNRERTPPVKIFRITE